MMWFASGRPLTSAGAKATTKRTTGLREPNGHGQSGNHFADLISLTDQPPSARVRSRSSDTRQPRPTARESGTAVCSQLESSLPPSAGALKPCALP